MSTYRKRQKVASACERCRKRKLGCDKERPCQLCVRAGAECIARDPVAPEQAPTTKRPAATPESALRSSNVDDKYGSTGLLGEDLVLPESSIVDLTALVLSKMSLGSSLDQDTSALPGGNKIISRQLFQSQHWRQIVGVQLPDDATLSQLVDKFFASVDWFMMVFEESLFRERYSQLLSSSHVAYHEQNFLWLSMLVVALGAHYTSLSQTPLSSDSDLKRMSVEIMAQIESRFLQFMGCATVEAVQISILLGSYLLFSGKPNVGMAVSGAGVKIAQVINLHRENLWRDCSPAEKETRRRTWWALEVYDKYFAVAFGRPCIVDDSDCNVSMVLNLSPASPGQTSDTSLQFHQWKFRLYRIMGQFIGRRRQNSRASTVQTIHEELTEWRNQLPTRLRIESYNDIAAGDNLPIRQMQAVALQLTYDNLHIILHRTVAFKQGNKPQTTPEGLFSLRHLIDAAMRTSSLHRFPNSLYELRRTHANMHVGITLFTAGIVLCIVCLSQPLSNASQRAKGGVMHIIRACKDASNPQNIASSQSIAVLERLVAVVLQHENELITGKGHTSTHINNLDGQNDVPSTQGHAIGSAPNPLPLDTQPRPQAQNPPLQIFSSAPAVSGLAADSVTGTSLDGFNWDGSLSVLMEAGLADASQMWLWAENDETFGYPS